MVFFSSTCIRCLLNIHNLTNPKGKVTFSRKNIQKLCRIALFYTLPSGKVTLFRKNIQSVYRIRFFCIQIWAECDLDHFLQLAAEKAPIQPGSSFAPYALRHNRPACFFTIYCFYENAQSGRCYSRAERDRLLGLLNPPAKLVKPFALGLAAYGSIAPNAQRKEVAS